MAKTGRPKGQKRASAPTVRASGSQVETESEPPRERIRRSVMDRAAKSAALCTKRVNALNALVNRFHGDATPSQAEALVALTSLLGDVTSAMDEIGGHVAVLKDSHYRPRMSAGASTRALQPGQLVQVKAKKYDPEFHGANDDLIVIKASGINVLVKHGANGSPFPIPRSFLEMAEDEQWADTEDDAQPE